MQRRCTLLQPVTNLRFPWHSLHLILSCFFVMNDNLLCESQTYKTICQLIIHYSVKKNKIKWIASVLHVPNGRDCRVKRANIKNNFLTLRFPVALRACLSADRSQTCYRGDLIFRILNQMKNRQIERLCRENIDFLCITL